ncbi:hypothetical protein BLNAU_12601 [Blattamonas nauphoetae]|uniref:Ras-GEF domain-containing protein n=1 Tax=Blattamonas nauphoetae TaxID=2049346 RepID=A0ABQ9XJ84_9EUKA|nr:hypothetical protein BLNAU_12601 [Blattamonas nauphoetae]
MITSFNLSIFPLTNTDLPDNVNDTFSVLFLPPSVVRVATTFFLNHRLFISPQDVLHLLNLRAFPSSFPPRDTAASLPPHPQDTFDSLNHAYDGPVPTHDSRDQHASVTSLQSPYSDSAVSPISPLKESQTAKLKTITFGKSPRRSNPSPLSPLGSPPHPPPSFDGDVGTPTQTAEEKTQSAIIARVTALLCFWIWRHRTDFEAPVMLHLVNHTVSLIRRSIHPHNTMLASIVGGFLFDSFQNVNFAATFSEMKEQNVRLKEKEMKKLQKQAKTDSEEATAPSQRKGGLVSLIVDAKHEWADTDRESTNIKEVLFLSMLTPIETGPFEPEGVDENDEQKRLIALLSELVLHSPQQFVRQLTVMQLEMMLVVRTDELVNAMCDSNLKTLITKRLSTEPAFNPRFPNLSRLLHHIHTLSVTISRILLASSSEQIYFERIANALLECCAECDAVHNWCAYKALVGGLEMAIENGLPLSSLLPGLQAKLAEVQAKGGAKGNFGVLRRQMRTTDKKVTVCIPCIEAYLFDLTVLNDNLPHVIAGNVNYTKFLNVRKCVDEVRVMIEHVEFVDALKTDPNSQALLVAMENVIGE